MKKTKRNHRSYLLMMVVAMLSLVMMKPCDCKAAVVSTMNKNLISFSSCNRNEGSITYKVRVPTNTTVSTILYTIRNSNTGNGAWDIHKKQLKNTSKKTVTKTVTEKINYYGKYTVQAEYTKSKKRTYDKHTVISSTPSATFYTKEFKWDKKSIANYRKNKAIKFAINVVKDKVVSYVILAPVGATTTVFKFGKHIINAKQLVDMGIYGKNLYNSTVLNSDIDYYVKNGRKMRLRYSCESEFIAVTLQATTSKGKWVNVKSMGKLKYDNIVRVRISSGYLVFDNIDQ